jgi:hypothetical protein
MMQQEQMNNKKRVRAAKKGPIANKVVRITDKNYEELLQFGEVGKPLAVAFANVLEAAMQSRQASIVNRKARRAAREKALAEYDAENNNTTTNKLTTIENSGIQNVGVRSASTGHHSLSTSATPETGTFRPDLTTNLAGDESLHDTPRVSR